MSDDGTSETLAMSGAMFGGFWWTVGNGSQVRISGDAERRWIEPSVDDLLAMLRSVGVDPIREVEWLTRERDNANDTLAGVEMQARTYKAERDDLRIVSAQINPSPTESSPHS